LSEWNTDAADEDAGNDTSGHRHPSQQVLPGSSTLLNKRQTLNELRKHFLNFEISKVISIKINSK